MELVWLIVQALLFCTALLAVTCSLMFAPWYILLMALGIVLIVIQQLMAKLSQDASELALPLNQGNAAIAQPNTPTKPAPPETMKPSADPQPTYLIYRGVDYVPSPTVKPSPTTPRSTPLSTHLVYRGVDYVLSQDREEPSG